MRVYRQFLILIVFSLLFVSLIARLLWLQSHAVVDAAAGKVGLVQKSVNQRRASIVIDNRRGRIVDRHGAALAGMETQALLVLQPADDAAGEVADILGATGQQWRQFLHTRRLPALWRKEGELQPAALSREQAERLRRLQLDGMLLVVPSMRRYAEPAIASQLLGFVAENPAMVEDLYANRLEEGWMSKADQVGAAGLERTFDRFLQPVDERKWAMYTDGRSHPLGGLTGRYVQADNRFYPLELRTTVDAALQRKIEALLERHRVDDGSVVVLGAATGDIAAMAGKPDFDPYHVIPEEGRWRNTAIASYAPGSVFKTVVAIAALEAGIAHPGEQFQCNGEWHAHRLRCWKRHGHGQITLEQAYAQSCNVTFATLAAKLGAERLSRTAEKLGIGSRVGWSQASLSTPIGVLRDFHQLDGEQAGQLFDRAADQEDEGVLARTGIGQQDVRMSPLQAARLTAMIVNGGYKLSPRIVSQVRMNNGRTFAEFPVRGNEERAFSGRTAAWLADAMRLVVRDGTGQALSDVPGGAGGKTGTAQTGTGDTAAVHQWFIGFAPAHAPLYTFAVLVRNQPPDGPHKALSVAEDLVRPLAD